MLEAKRAVWATARGDWRYLIRSTLFLMVLGTLGVISQGPLLDAFSSNFALNGTIVGILVFGILYTFIELIRVLRDARAAVRASILVDEVQRGERPLNEATDVLLSPSQRGLADFLHTVYRVIHQTDASATLPYLLDSVAVRGEDKRALVRYLTGALVLLGLIGTFYGLLITIDGVRGVLTNLSVEEADDTIALLTGLRERLAVPLTGMGLAFSSSLFGLLASLILAFVELQLFHAQNSLHGRLEGLVVSELIPLWQTGGQTGGLRSTGQGSVSPRYLNALMEVTGDRLDRVVSLLESQAHNDGGASRLGKQLAVVGEHIESLRDTLQILERDRTADLRHELRLMSRALSQDKRPHAPED
jgi:hypothetical protein